MAGHTTRQAQFRLPIWVSDYLAQRAMRTGRTKTDVVIEAVACLRECEEAEAMEIGYREQAFLSTDIAEEAIAVAPELLDEW